MFKGQIFKCEDTATHFAPEAEVPGAQIFLEIPYLPRDILHAQEQLLMGNEASLNQRALAGRSLELQFPVSMQLQFD